MSAGTSAALWPENAPDPTDNSVAHTFAISSGTVAAWAVLDDLLSPYLLFMSHVLNSRRMRLLDLPYFLIPIVARKAGRLIHEELCLVTSYRGPPRYIAV